ncbi:hypothetical protein [Microvirga yunnanensis]|uniref:hypothetical protein n=1 Tax=Microvirga yunnanensis TaxID=2953740 RepID=UPI0021C89B9C|nr:hypothetical protein [Microvirga sp. HBU65207]
MAFATRRLSALPDAIAPDGSEGRILCGTGRGSLAHFTLPPHAVSKAMARRSVEEVWYFVSGPRLRVRPSFRPIAAQPGPCSG